MMVLMFRERFVERIRSGKKTQTIRRPRASNPIQVEDWLSLRRWEGTPYRSRQEEVGFGLCESVRPILIAVYPRDCWARIAIGEWLLSCEEIHAFVRADGFQGVVDFVCYYNELGVLAFKGVLIEWALEPVEKPVD